MKPGVLVTVMTRTLTLIQGLREAKHLLVSLCMLWKLFSYIRTQEECVCCGEINEICHRLVERQPNQEEPVWIIQNP